MKSGLQSASQNFLFISLTLLVILSIAFLLPIQPNDYGWYLRLGGEIVHTGTIPSVEFMSYTQAGRPVIFQHWLSGVIFWGIDQIGGASLTNLVRGCLIALFYVFIWSLCRMEGAGRVEASLITLLVALAGSNNWAVRPQLFAYPLFGWALWLFWRWHKGVQRGLWGLPVLALLWINLHSSFILLFAVGVTALILGRGQRKVLLIWLGLALATTFINPRGIFVWSDTLVRMNDPSIQQFATEWNPPVNQGWQLNLFFGWILLFPLLVGLSSVKLDRLQWIWFIGFGWLALTGTRYGIWFTAILGFASAGLLHPMWKKFVKIKFNFSLTGVNLVLGGLLLLLPLALLPGIREVWWEQAPHAYADSIPLTATEWLRVHPDIPGPLWADLVYSSYLVGALPERPVWIYTSFEFFPPEQWQRYLKIARAEPGWEIELENAGIRLVLLSKTDQPRLIQVILAEPDWRVEFEDDNSILISKKS